MKEGEQETYGQRETFEEDTESHSALPAAVV
jgi:hypothetical protein